MASNFFNKASLVMVPDAPIDGKLPSVKPEDRSGDFIFSRGSNLAATRVNKNGLIEKGRENLLLQSNQFNTTWDYTNNTLVSGQSGYDGSNNAWFVTKIPASYVPLTQSVSVSGVNTFSFYAKAGTAAFVRTYIPSGNWIINFDFASGNATNEATTNGLISYSMTSVGNGWYRCSSTHSGSITEVRIYNEWVQTNASTYYVQDAQLEQGLVATEYIETTTAAVQKGILENLPRLDYSGGATCPSLLLEPQRTNHIWFSEWFGAWDSFSTLLTYKDGISPSGYKDATKLYIPADNANVYIRTQFYNVANQTHIGSIFLKKVDGDEVRLRLSGSTPNIEASAIFNLSNGTYRDAVGSVTPSIENYGNGWYRCSVGDLGGATVATPSLRIDALGTGYAPTVYVWGAQVEVGSYPTSYIPTYGSSVTRSTDSCQIASGISDLLPQGTGTMYVEVTMDDAVDTEGYLMRIEQASFANSIFIARSTAGNLFASYRNNNSTIFSFQKNNVADTFKAAFAFESGNSVLYVNGEKIGASSVTYTPAVTYDDLRVGGFTANTANMSGVVSQAMVFKTRLTDDECIALTTI